MGGINGCWVRYFIKRFTVDFDFMVMICRINVCGASNSFSIRSDEGLIHELRGPNYPNYVMNVGHQLEAGIGAGSARCEGRCFLR